MPQPTDFAANRRIADRRIGRVPVEDEDDITLDDVVNAWNIQADEYNQWDELDDIERLEWTLRFIKGRAPECAPRPDILTWAGVFCLGFLLGAGAVGALWVLG